MKTKFLIPVMALAALATPAWANTPSPDAFQVPNDQTTQPAPDRGDGSAYVAPFGDHLRQNRTEDMRRMDRRGRNNLIPPGMDASGVPAPRV